MSEREKPDGGDWYAWDKFEAWADAQGIRTDVEDWDAWWACWKAAYKCAMNACG